MGWMTYEIACILWKRVYYSVLICLRYHLLAFTSRCPQATIIHKSKNLVRQKQHHLLLIEK